MILFLSNADTELLALGSIVHRLPAGFPAVRAGSPGEDAPGLGGVTAVVIRLLGGRSAWERPFDALRKACLAQRIPLVAVGGEAAPDAELTRLSTVPAGIVAEAHRYLVAGGPDNVEQLVRFVADTVLVGGFGFEPPTAVPSAGVWYGAGIGSPERTRDDTRPLVGVVFYRAHLVAGNTQFVADLCRALEDAGAEALAVYCYSLRPDPDDGRVEALELCRAHGVDALVTTVLAMGRAGDGADGDWEVPDLAALGVPVVQAPSCNRSRDEWDADDAGLTPLDVARGVAIPEFDGRIVGPAFAFKEEVDDGGELGTPLVA
ncbi:MAG TPA: cobaltochelatase subunit CobN, partial [Acidimicrobiales bacterium]|nr:cobaltochelatase subunit CobN [Acidimicrobiales bacterium]